MSHKRAGWISIPAGTKVEKMWTCVYRVYHMEMDIIKWLLLLHYCAYTVGSCLVWGIRKLTSRWYLVCITCCIGAHFFILRMTLLIPVLLPCLSHFNDHIFCFLSNLFPTLSPKFFTANIIFGSYLGVICFRPEKKLSLGVCSP